MRLTTFLNIDLDLESTEDLSLLVKEFGTKAIVMRAGFENGLYVASFETVKHGLNEMIAEYGALVEGLSDEAKKLWGGCRLRRFDIGYESGAQPLNFHSSISNASLSILHALGTDLVITIYPPQAENGQD